MSKSDNVQVHTKYIAPSEKTLPPLALQITQLVGSYMIWVGITEEPAEKAEIAPSQGSLLRDWACAMPPTNVSTVKGVRGNIGILIGILKDCDTPSCDEPVPFVRL